MNALARLWWTTIPALVARISPANALALADGADYRAMPVVAGLAPILALALGYACSAMLPQGLEAYTGSLLICSIVLAIGCAASGLGCWAVAGYAIGDILSRHHPYFTNWWTWLAALVISYAVMGLLAVGVPTTSRLVARSLVPARMANGRIAATALCGAVLAYMWSQSAPLLIRPLFTFSGGSPSVDGIAPTQTQGLIYSFVAAFALVGFGMVRARFAASVAGSSAVLESAKARAEAARIGVPWQARVMVRAAFLALIFSGMSQNVWESLGIFVVLAAIFAGNEYLGAKADYVAMLTRVPFGLRYVVTVAATLAVSWFVVMPLFGSTQTYDPLLYAIAIGLAIGAALFPAVRTTAVVAAAFALFCVLVPSAAFADNCSGLGDCFTLGQWAVIAAAAVAIIAIGGFAIAAAAAAEAAEAAAAAAAADAAAAAAADAAATAAADAAATAAADAAAETAAEAAAEDAAADAAADVTGDALESTENAGYPDFNPDGGTTNCGDVASAVDDWLGGGEFRPGSASVDGMSPDVLAGDQGANWSGTQNGFDGINNYLQNAGDGARGIVNVWNDGSGMSHFFNVVNEGGNIVAIDGQSGVVGSLGEVSGFDGFGSSPWVQFLPTWP